MLSSVEQAFVGRDEKRPLKTLEWEAVRMGWLTDFQSQARRCLFVENAYLRGRHYFI